MIQYDIAKKIIYLTWELPKFGGAQHSRSACDCL